MRAHRLLLAAALAAALAACGGGGDDATTTSTTTTTQADDTTVPDDDAGDGADATEDPEVEVVATGLEVPWDVAFLDGTAYVTERDTGRVLRLTDDGGTEEVRTFEVDDAGEAGLLGLAAEPGGDRLYAYYTSPDDNRVVAFRPGDDDVEPIVTGIPRGPIHDGGRLEFGPDGRLHIGTGDASQAEIAQDPDSLGGKILRVTPDGEVPDDNPQEGSPVLSLGHRNVQGLAWDDDGTLYATELGPDVDDELNRIEPGGNYGWPEVTGEVDDDLFVDPIGVYQPAEASPSGAALVSGEGSGAWEGDLVFTALRGEQLWRVELADDGTVAAEHTLLEGEYGRLRHVEQAPDGSLWVLTSNRDGRGDPAPDDDRILRLVPPGA